LTADLSGSDIAPGFYENVDSGALHYVSADGRLKQTHPDIKAYKLRAIRMPADPPQKEDEAALRPAIPRLYRMTGPEGALPRAQHRVLPDNIWNDEGPLLEGAEQFALAKVAVGSPDEAVGFLLRVIRGRLRLTPHGNGSNARGSTTAKEAATEAPGDTLKILVKPGDQAQDGDTLFILEVMKSETPHNASSDDRPSAKHVLRQLDLAAGLAIRYDLDARLNEIVELVQRMQRHAPDDAARRSLAARLVQWTEPTGEDWRRHRWRSQPHPLRWNGQRYDV
jgi:hypothetical protein